jgi:hypothetical protein
VITFLKIFPYFFQILKKLVRTLSSPPDFARHSSTERRRAFFCSNLKVRRASSGGARQEQSDKREQRAISSFFLFFIHGSAFLHRGTRVAELSQNINPKKILSQGFYTRIVCLHSLYYFFQFAMWWNANSLAHS